ncbi:MAG TPA: hypothetical protein P5318_13575 [Candidatus Hydrogenedentes bacterium]|nr:hypothetical protein [Candidatus Hydrogenedentota bacterium]HPC15411.1 hypothetical protein [Candidatus Hydrogenedentota bacterium]HRT21150.1 hypothetical protein [Candidatus Hydrogenedentota bacterium]HRT64375.1 hypothetical protein [Candidatus Hydrogenedentota bacterium]
MNRLICTAIAAWMILGVWCAYAQEGTGDMAKTKFTAGFARVDITPAAGCEIPGGFAKNIAKGVHDPLFVEAAVFTNGTTSMAVVGADIIMAPDDVVAEARKLAESRTGIPSRNILIAASHTHNGGPVVDCLGSERDPAYCTLVAQRIAEAIALARANAVEARVGVGVGHEDTVGFNRRFKMKDGSERTHPGKMNPDILEPAGPIDPDVGVISVVDTQGGLLGCIVNYTLHGTVIGGSELSADWICYLRKTIRGALGNEQMGVVFLNGACGDVTQVDNRSPRPSEFGEAWAKRVGMTVGAEALKVIARLDYADDIPLAAATEILNLPIRDLAESDEELVARETPATGLGSSHNDVYLKEARLVREMKAKSPTVPVEVQALRIGPAALVTNPTEYFCALGLAIKKGSPVKPVFVVELANGYAGYSPTAEAFQGGGYEIRTARSSYLAPGTGERIAETSIRLLGKL